jgi:hypothetical protein
MDQIKIKHTAMKRCEKIFALSICSIKILRFGMALFCLSQKVGIPPVSLRNIEWGYHSLLLIF